LIGVWKYIDVSRGKYLRWPGRHLTLLRERIFYISLYSEIKTGWEEGHEEGIDYK